MNPFDTTDLHYTAPPPAYSEQEFDQKVSRAIELSNQTSNGAPSSADDDEWEPYDPAAFEAAAAAYEAQQKQQAMSNSSQQLGGPSISPPPQPPSHTWQGQPSQPIQQTQPLRIHKKVNSQDLKPKKEEPKWASMINGQAGASSGSQPPVLRVYNAYDGDDLAPPPFAETAPEPYSGHQVGDVEFDPYAMYPPSESPAVNQVQPSPSPPNNFHPQPSISDIPHQTAQPPQLYVPSDHLTPNYNRQSMPASPSTPRVHRTDHRPYSEIGPASPTQGTQRSYLARSFSSSGSMLQFNPSVAYGKTPQRQLPQAMPVHEQPGPPQVYNPSAFYNAAVSAHMQTPVKTRTTNTYPNANGYDQSHFANGNVGGFNSTIPSGGWSPASRQVSTFSTGSSYGDGNGGRVSPYSTPNRPNIEWQHHNYR